MVETYGESSMQKFNSCSEIKEFFSLMLKGKKGFEILSKSKANLDRREKTMMNYNMITMFLHVSWLMRFLQNIN